MRLTRLPDAHPRPSPRSRRQRLVSERFTPSSQPFPSSPIVAEAPIARSVTFNLKCSRGALGKDLYGIVVSEPSTCQYQINVSARHSPASCWKPREGDTRSVPINEHIYQALCHRVVLPLHPQASSPLACGCEPMCGTAGNDNKICGSDGCGGYCSSVELEGDCPYAANVQQVSLKLADWA